MTQVPYCENFDGVTAPALAPGWTQGTDLGGADPHWLTVAAGCGNGDFCANNPNTRGQMAVFLSKTFGLKLNGP